MATLRIAVVHKGTYSAATAYAVMDEVEYQGSSYRCIQAGTNQTPSSAATFWTMVSQKGTQGAQGTQGTQGTQGNAGSVSNMAISYNLSTGIMTIV